MTDSESGLVLVPGEPFVVREHNGSKLRLAHLPADGSPKLERVSPLKGSQTQWFSPVIFGDEVFCYVPGVLITRRVGRHEIPNQCDPSRTGTYRRMNLKTGRETTWRVHTRCRALGTLFVPPHRDTTALFFNELDERGSLRIYRLDRATLAVSEVGVDPYSRAIHATPDGTRLLIADFGGLVLWDAERDEERWRLPVDKDTARAVFTRGESPRPVPPPQQSAEDAPQ